MHGAKQTENQLFWGFTPGLKASMFRHLQKKDAGEDSQQVALGRSEFFPR